MARGQSGQSVQGMDSGLSLAQFYRYSYIAGLPVAVVALVSYLLTLEPTVSLWDCGEFISCAYKLQVTHPPGAPFFLLVGRIFSLFAGSPEKVALAVNTLSAVASAGAVYLLFLVTVFFARRALVGDTSVLRWGEALILWLGGTVAGLAIAYADSFWFSAVEAEVYALSIFLAALIVWMITQWVRARTRNVRFADHWLLLIAYVAGLVMGVHLLGLLALPFAGVVWYQHKKGLRDKVDYLLAFLVGAVSVGLIQFLILPGVPWLLTRFELLFVNVLGLPFYSGMVVGLVLLMGGLLGLGIWLWRRGYSLLAYANLAVFLVLLGYSTYALIVIRSLANPPIDMNDPEDPFRLLAYVRREQYGEQPLLWGPLFTASPQRYEREGPLYRQDKEAGKYVSVGYRLKPVYPEDSKVFFPRIWDANHAGFYRRWLNLHPNEIPTYADNLYFFFSYQVGWMYMRYLFWNFIGRQNDIQGHGLDVRNGHWLSGITWLDELRLGVQRVLPFFQAWNKGRNRFYFLPFLLGLLGLFYLIVRRPDDAFSTFVLFFMWGIAIVIYLNQYPQQPRERDYSYAGSFWVFALWIGVGTVAVYDWVRRMLWARTPAIIAALATLIAPILMGVEGWDDHTRANRYTARDIAISYLESCAPNAILFTEGDNDTYPLWYAQEVEGVRPDIRIVNLSLLGVDWYIDFLRRKANDADPLPIRVHPKKYAGSRRDYTPVIERLDTNKYWDLRRVLAFVFSDKPATKLMLSWGERIDYFPTSRVYLPIDQEDIEDLLRTGAIQPEDTSRVVRRMQWRLPRTILKNQLMLLHIIAENDWERPIYFAVTIHPRSFVGLRNYLQLEGLTYRLVPIYTPSSPQGYGRVALHRMYETVMNKFRWGDLDKYEYVYLDENHRRLLYNMRLQSLRLAEALYRAGKKDSARRVLDLMMEKLPDRQFPWDYLMPQVSDLYFRLGAPEVARMIADTLLSRAERDMVFFEACAGRGARWRRELFISYRQDFAKVHHYAQFFHFVGRRVGDTVLVNRAQQLLLRIQALLQEHEDILQYLQ